MKRFLYTLGGVGLAVWSVSRLMRSDFSFEGKSIVITGGSRGLGLTIAKCFAAEGARLVLLARNRDELDRACAELRAMGAEAIGISCDLLDRGQSLGAIEEVVDRFGAVDVLVNNAGIIEIGPLENMQRSDFEKSLQLHFWAPYHLMRQVIPHMRRRGGGRIVNISSIGGRLAVPHMAPYSASKFALTGLSDAFRAELAREDILVTTVAPGMMRTGSHVQAKFKGNHGAEYTWFSLSAGLPFGSMEAGRAALKIVEACRRGQSSLVLGVSARAAIIGNALFPGLAGELMKLVNRLLPSPTGGEGDQLLNGWDAREQQHAPRWLTQWADREIGPHNGSRPHAS